MISCTLRRTMTGLQARPLSRRNGSLNETKHVHSNLWAGDRRLSFFTFQRSLPRLRCIPPLPLETPPRKSQPLSNAASFGKRESEGSRRTAHCPPKRDRQRVQRQDKPIGPPQHHAKDRSLIPLVLPAFLVPLKVEPRIRQANTLRSRCRIFPGSLTPILSSFLLFFEASLLHS